MASSQSSQKTAVLFICIVALIIGVMVSISMNKKDQPITSNPVEPFVVSTPLPLTSYNTQLNSMNCNRNLSFAYQPGSSKSVYERALRVDSDTTCTINASIDQPSNDLIEVKEGELMYDLKMKCFGITMKQIEMPLTARFLQVTLRCSSVLSS